MKTYTVREIADRLGRDVSSVHRWLKRAKVRPVQNLVQADSRGQRVALFDAAMVDRLIEERYGKDSKV